MNMTTAVMATAAPVDNSLGAPKKSITMQLIYIGRGKMLLNYRGKVDLVAFTPAFISFTEGIWPTQS